MVDNIDIQGGLIKIGLSLQESNVYMALLQKGPRTIVQLSKIVNIPRSTIYRIIENLEEKGFVEKVLIKKTSMYKGVALDKLDFVIAEAKHKHDQVTEAMDLLKKMGVSSLHDVPSTQVRHYQGVSGIKQMLWNSLSAKDEVVGYSEFGRVDVVGNKFYNEFVKEFKHRELKDRVITNETGFKYIEKHVLNEDEKHQLTIKGIKLIPAKKFYVAGDTSIYNDVYSVSFWKNGEIVGIEIENAELVRLHKSIFELLWGIAEPYVGK